MKRLTWLSIMFFALFLLALLVGTAGMLTVLLQ